jgi:hypothetical protein
MKFLSLLACVLLLSTLAFSQPLYTGAYGSSPHCQGCHALAAPPNNQFGLWSGTNHSAAYDHLTLTQQQDPVCLPCHTTGWDTQHANGGFDDYFYSGDSLGMVQMKNVQCESCHGATDEYPHPSTTTVSYQSELCGNCHTGMGRPVYDEWVMGAHAVQAPLSAQTLACAKCHEAQTAAEYHRTGVIPGTLPENPVWQVTCSACHGTHWRPLYEGQLYLAEGRPDSTCKACHNMDGATVGQVPHAPQQNMLRGVGAGAYEWEGFHYVNSCHECEIPGVCALCHMDSTTYSGQTEPHAGHSVTPRIHTCLVCHSGSEWVPPDSSFNFKGVQTHTDSMLTVLAAALSQADTTTLTYRRAKFDYDFVLNDGSRGVHNFIYADDLLIASIANLALAVEPIPDPNVPLSFGLTRARPNPFNAASVISFELRVPSQVSLRIYDTAGRLAATLVEGWKPAGRHEAVWNASDFASGVYLEIGRASCRERV